MDSTLKYWLILARDVGQRSYKSDTGYIQLLEWVHYGAQVYYDTTTNTINCKHYYNGESQTLYTDSNVGYYKDLDEYDFGFGFDKDAGPVSNDFLSAFLWEIEIFNEQVDDSTVKGDYSVTCSGCVGCSASIG